MAVPYRAFGLMYHNVVDDAGNVGFRHSAAASYQVGIGAFQAHLAAVAQGPLCPVTVLECADGLLPACLLLTFDDGESSALAAAEMLEERGWRGHFFITTGLIGSARVRLRRRTSAGCTCEGTSSVPIRTRIPISVMICRGRRCSQSGSEAANSWRRSPAGPFSPPPSRAATWTARRSPPRRRPGSGFCSRPNRRSGPGRSRGQRVSDECA